MDKLCLWTPFPKQAEALKRHEFEILYGGARGGGKTDAGINWLIYNVANPKLRALIIRKNSKDLSDWSDRAYRIYQKLGAVRVGNPPKFNWPSGAVFSTGHLMDANAYTQYQGHEYQNMVLEELDQIPQEKHYLELMSSCRSTVDGLKPQIFCTSNPGGKGHGWVKRRFIDPAPPNTRFSTTTKLPNGKEIELDRVYIPATMDDNPILMDKDPAYVARIEQLKDKYPEKYRAWRFGDWDVFAGQVFSEFRRDRHVIKSLTPKASLTHFLWMDWGYTAPFSCHASALIRMKYDGEVFHRVVTYQEWYGVEKNPDEWAEEIFSEEKDESGNFKFHPARHRKFNKAVVDPAMLNTQTDGSTSIGDLMMRKWKDLHGESWCRMDRGNNKRHSQVPTMKNWLSMAPDGLPYWVITEDCTNLIRTLPELIYDEHKPEEIDTTQEDHAADECSYGLKAVKFISVGLGAFGKQPEKRKYEIAPMVDEEGEMGITLDTSKFGTGKVVRKRESWDI